MTPRAPAWQRSDDRILITVLFAAGDGSAPLQTLVGVGDYLSHAIFTYEELTGGLERLLAAGHQAGVLVKGGAEGLGGQRGVQHPQLHAAAGQHVVEWGLLARLGGEI